MGGGRDADGRADGGSVVVPADVLRRYEAFTLFNSPYPAHDAGHAIDLYPGMGAPSPVAGEVVAVHTVRAPPRPYGARDDHLIVVDIGAHLARILHVDPDVGPGDAVAVGDPLGATVRSGFFAPWVDDHLHLGFRPHGADARRAAGSLPVDVAVDIVGAPWDGTGTVVERADTYVVLDAPGHPDPGARFAGIADGAGVLDGGVPHYQGGGRFAAGAADGDVVGLAGSRVGVADGRTVTWDDLEVRVDGTPVTGVSLALHRDRLGVKLVSWDGVPADVGDRVSVTVHRRV